LKNRFKEFVMYAKFPFYSVAQMYALTLNEPVAILLGGDHLYWVVDRHNEVEYLKEGFSVLSHAS
jgi:hypothetical protein